jgi:hypothetical protein
MRQKENLPVIKSTKTRTETYINNSRDLCREIIMPLPEKNVSTNHEEVKNKA